MRKQRTAVAIAASVLSLAGGGGIAWACGPGGTDPASGTTSTATTGTTGTTTTTSTTGTTATATTAAVRLARRHARRHTTRQR